MNHEFKKRLVRAVLVIFALWPLGQLWMTQEFGLSSWKLFGWGMYATPQREVGTHVLEIRGGKPIDFDQALLPPDARKALEKFRSKRISLGNLVRPDRAGDAVLLDFPRFDGALIIVELKSLDAKSARIQVTRDTYAYFREGDDAHGSPKKERGTEP